MWHRSGGILIPEEKNAMTVGQVWPISQKQESQDFLDVWKVVTSFGNKFRQEVTESRDLCVVFLALANGSGVVPHTLLWKTFSYLKVSEKISALVKASFEVIQFLANGARDRTGDGSNFQSVLLLLMWEEASEKAFERKELKYAELVAEAREQGWQAHTRPVEIGARG